MSAHDLVGLARRAADRQHAQAVGSRVDLALRRRPDPHERVGVEVDPLAFDVDPPGAADRQEGLLLTAVGVVVFGVVGVVRRKLDHLHAEGRDAELGPHLDEPAAEAGLHLIDALCRVVGHRAHPNRSPRRISSASWRDWASSVPSAAQMTPSSSKKPSCTALERKRAKHSSCGSEPAGRGVPVRKWIVRSIVGLTARSLQADEGRREQRVAEERERERVDRPRSRRGPASRRSPSAALSRRTARCRRAAERRGAR